MNNSIDITAEALKPVSTIPPESPFINPPTTIPSEVQTVGPALTNAQIHQLLRRAGKASKHRKPTKGAFGKSHFWDRKVE